MIRIISKTHTKYWRSKNNGTILLKCLKREKPFIYICIYLKYSSKDRKNECIPKDEIRNFKFFEVYVIIMSLIVNLYVI